MTIGISVVPLTARGIEKAPKGDEIGNGRTRSQVFEPWRPVMRSKTPLWAYLSLARATRVPRRRCARDYAPGRGTAGRIALWRFLVPGIGSSPGSAPGR